MNWKLSHVSLGPPRLWHPLAWMSRFVSRYGKQNGGVAEATVDWQFTTEKARVKLKRLYRSIQL